MMLLMILLGAPTMMTRHHHAAGDVLLLAMVTTTILLLIPIVVVAATTTSTTTTATTSSASSSEYTLIPHHKKQLLLLPLPSYNFYATKATATITHHFKKEAKQTILTKKLPWTIVRMRGGGEGDDHDHGATSGSEEGKNANHQDSYDVEVVETQDDDDDDMPFEIVNETIVYSRWRQVVQRQVRLKATAAAAAAAARKKQQQQLSQGISANDADTNAEDKIINFDIIRQKDDMHAVIIFAFNTTSKTATIIREYMPASNKIMFGLAAGILEADSKHKNDGDDDGNDTRPPSLIAARCELEEECHLIHGTWIPLTTPPASAAGDGDDRNDDAHDTNDDSIGGTYMDKYCSQKLYPYLVLDPIQTDDPRPLDDDEYIEIVPNVSIEEILKLITTNQFTITGSWACLLAINKLKELGLI